MKHILLKLIIVFLLTATIPPVHGGWFDKKEDPSQKRLVQVEQELTQQRKANDSLSVIIGILGIGCVLLLVIGTALGSKIRRHHEHQP
ncbi:hypothetical protein DES53_107286 [Roseimicrobium gellanilyticum]|uniref:Uncharacterized protein n=1 Tax=Roseimicrobium gellanilyticum TaxID=748857 RepID=A0A366HFV8_9BACT|nr:hypothetical protein [Roseimicrobium gellanilyticum]RBP41454.1 hypothetical protein DES53_107286 [Roseimicrobium gellanilyticum]